MTIELINGDNSFFNECAESLHNSDLGKYYFPSIQKAQEAINGFINTDYFLVAIDNDKKFVGFICYLPTGAFHAFPYLHLLVTSSRLEGKGIGTLYRNGIDEYLMMKRKDK